MACQREIFSVSGPFQLTIIDWRNAHHRRTVAASLVQGAYNLEHDRQQNNQGPQALAPPWWEFFGFKLNHVLVDDHDVSYFGAIYEYKFSHPWNGCSGQNPPRYVIAFRGTLTIPENRKEDIKLDLQFIRHNLHQSTRFHRALQAVENIVAMAGPGNVWLAGHSLGSAIALLVGRNMVAKGFHLETYLFNPPFDSPPIERIKHEKIKDGIRIASSLITAGIAAAVQHSHRPKPEKEDPFTVLSEWIPYLFLNPSDLICCEYIGYFQHREKMVSIGAGKIGQLATQTSIVSVISGVRGKEHEPVYISISRAYQRGKKFASMASEREIFDISGPFNLTCIDWGNPYHRRSIAASLVKGAYILERDRQQKRGELQALAPRWWKFFGFELKRVLVDDDDKSYFGAIYEYENYNCPGHPPRYVIAFRGTITTPDSGCQDLKLDLQVIRNCLHRCSRFQHGLEIAQNIVSGAEAGNVWLAGHSLGSAIALLVGRNMVMKMRFHIETYLFNPPFTSAPIEIIQNEILKHSIRFVTSVITAGLAVAVGQKPKPNHEDPFIVLSTWIPYLFVNPSDPICSEYVDYFERRDRMMAVGAGKLGTLATQNSILCLLTAGKDSEPIHLLPSAHLYINMSTSQNLKQAHGIKRWWKKIKQAHGVEQWRKVLKQAHGIEQWWKPDIYCNYKLHQFK